MARNTIVAIILGVFTVILITMATMDIITGEVFATSLTGITSVATIIIGITSKDNQDK
jgi:hypothetical protein